MLAHKPCQLQVNMQKDGWLHNCRILVRRNLLYLQICDQSWLSWQLHNVEQLERLRRLWCPEGHGEVLARNQAECDKAE